MVKRDRRGKTQCDEGGTRCKKRRLEVFWYQIKSNRLKMRKLYETWKCRGFKMVELRLTALLSDLRARAGEGDSELLVS